ncbi:MAG: OstA-like protein, partial [Bacteroidota bacterium]
MRDVLLQQSSRTAWLTALLCLLWTATFSQTQNPPTNPPQNPPANVAQNTPPGQEPENRLEIISTKVFRFGHFGKDSIKIRKLLGNVHLRQDTTDFLCDTAYQYIDSNYVEAWSNVRINMKNGRTITANRLTYNGRTKILNLYGRVVLEDSTVKLETERLTYYRIPDYGYYPTPGKVTTGENILTSERGFYYPSREMAYFKDSV